MTHKNKKQHDKTYREKHKEELKKKAAEKYQKNREQVLKKSAEYREKNRELLREKQRKYCEENKELIRERQKIAYFTRSEVRDKKLAYMREYQIATKPARNAYHVEYHKKYSEKHRQETKQWRIDNPEKAKRNRIKYNAARRARKIGAAGEFDYEGWMQRCEFYGWRCRYCGTELNEETVTMDHRIPLAKGGTNWISNLVPACKSCNCSKRDKTEQEYMAVA